MPSTIPYDPSLALISVVHPDAIKHTQEVTRLQEGVNAAEENLGSLMSSKRSLEMTKAELKNLGIDTHQLDAEMSRLVRDIDAATAKYAQAKVVAAPQIALLRQEIRAKSAKLESPVDQARSTAKTLPLAADTLNVDVQWFAFEKTTQNSGAHARQVASHVAGLIRGVLGADRATAASDAVYAQLRRRTETGDVVGTLVLTISCAHRNASVLAPFALDIDKAIELWNDLFPGRRLDTTDEKKLIACAVNGDVLDAEHRERFSIVSGTTFGSSFIGVVHVQSANDLDEFGSVITNLQSRLGAGNWVSDMGSGRGANAGLANELRNMLSQDGVRFEVTLFTNGEPSSNMGNGEDKRTDVNGMLVNLEQYFKEAGEGKSGVPINYYLKDFDMRTLAELWLIKYSPGFLGSAKFDEN
ncbi:hypothetical protein Micbo1qcDRAFT_202709 [Microdochium bolleyi]|uniref:Uncharacterized protein n=1 Tax=Microdochium bolleyi TaxID=196109 RepID=A0A136JCN0_9PEZI|nr:hypothetical protein Micbo1qcDRAFT_202709 [Microdochium bolleyi]